MRSTSAGQIMPLPSAGAELVCCGLEEAEADGVLEHVGAVYSAEDNTIRDGLGSKGPRIINFGNILKHGSFPLAALLRRFLEMGQAGMGSPVDIEFAANLSRGGQLAEFCLLQVRPTFASGDEVAVDITSVDEASVLCRGRNTMSNGEISGIRDIVYVVPERFSPLSTMQAAAEFSRINEVLLRDKRAYLAIGMGRWGTAEPSLGIPVRWSDVCGARVLIETGKDGYDIDPSHGTHFFQNMVAQRVAYLNVRPNAHPVDWRWLSGQEVISDLRYVRHVRAARPIRILIDGRRREGVVEKC